MITAFRNGCHGGKEQKLATDACKEHPEVLLETREWGRVRDTPWKRCAENTVNGPNKTKSRGHPVGKRRSVTENPSIVYGVRYTVPKWLPRGGKKQKMSKDAWKEHAEGSPGNPNTGYDVRYTMVTLFQNGCQGQKTTLKKGSRTRRRNMQKRKELENRVEGMMRGTLFIVLS